MTTNLPEYKFKLQFDLNMEYTDDPSARSKAETLLAAINALIEQHCNDPKPSLEKITLINQCRRDGFNLLSAHNSEIDNGF